MVIIYLAKRFVPSIDKIENIRIIVFISGLLFRRI